MVYRTIRHNPRHRKLALIVAGALAATALLVLALTVWRGPVTAIPAPGPDYRPAPVAQDPVCAAISATLNAGGNPADALAQQYAQAQAAGQSSFWVGLDVSQDCPQYSRYMTAAGGGQ